jgi:hypothetical protein
LSFKNRSWEGHRTRKRGRERGREKRKGPVEAERVKRKENTWERGRETGWRKVTSRNLMN